MRALLVGLVFVFFAMLGPACFERTCKNPKRGHPNGESGRAEGVLVQCNVVLVCATGFGAGGDTRKRLVGVEDTQITDSGSNVFNEDRCRLATKERGISGNCEIDEVSPEVICLDPPGSDGCNAGNGDGTVIIVGSAASGDYRSDPSGDGAGGQGGL
ncbi:MAG TPA: hypothetical protein VM694_14725 [Polyangium sp.]|nr:hypothetical protein [Polyangium sp.]